MQIEIKELKELKDQMNILVKEISSLKEIIEPKKRHLNLKEACELKGVHYKTVQNRSYLKPPVELAKKIGGRIVWERIIIEEWIPKSDEELKSEWERKKLLKKNEKK